MKHYLHLLGLVIIFGGGACWAGREIQTVLMSTRCEGKVESGETIYGTTTRLRVHLRNLSKVSQTVKVTYDDLQYTYSAAFTDKPTREAKLFSAPWTSQGVNNWALNAGFVPSHTSEERTILPGGRTEFTMSLQCFYSNSNPNCGLRASELGATTSLNSVVWVVTDNRYSLKLFIKDDGGAVVASAFAQTVCGGASSVYQSMDTFQINGGRPF